MFPMTLLILTMTSSRDKLTANRTSVSQLRMACLPAVVLDNAAADGTVRLSAARAPVLADTVAQNRFLVISESLHGDQ